MTVCIGAICERGDAVVVAADRQLTVMGLSLEFEHQASKIEDLGSTCVLMASGNSTVAFEVTQVMRRSAAAAPGTPFDAAAEALRKTYEDARMARAEQTILRPRGLDWTKWPPSQSMSAPVAQILFQEISQFNLQTSFILAGVDSAGAHLAQVHYEGPSTPGTLDRFDKIGYATIGSGMPHANVFLSLTGQNRDASLRDTLYNVHGAKVTSEVAPGVGEATDMAIISRTGVRHLSADSIAGLRRIFGRVGATQLDARAARVLDAIVKEYLPEHMEVIVDGGSSS